MSRKSKKTQEEVQNLESEAALFNQREELFEKVSTVEHPDNVPEEFPYQYFKKEFKPFIHQTQTVHLCLQAEKPGIKRTEVRNCANGELEGYADYECKIGCIANGTGSGKSVCAAALACYDVEETREEQNVGTSLISLKFSPVIDRPIIRITLILAKKSNCKKIYSDTVKYMKDGLISQIMDEKDYTALLSSVDVGQLENDYPKALEEYEQLNSELAQFEEENSRLIEDTIDEANEINEHSQKYAKRKGRTQVLEYFENLEMLNRMEKELEEKKIYYEFTHKVPEVQIGIEYEKNFKELEALHNYEGKLSQAKLKRYDFLAEWISDNEPAYKIAKQYMIYAHLFMGKKICICSEATFENFFPLFNTHRIQRLIVDEPHEINPINGEKFRRSFLDRCIDFLQSPKNPENTIARERSPAVMIWVMSATIHHMFENEDLKRRFFIAWLSRNAPFLRDFLNSLGTSYRFPQMVSNQIIKFSKDYSNINITGGRSTFEKIYCKIKRPVQLQLVEGIFEGDENANIQEYMNNDNEHKIMEFFGIDDIEKISQGIVNKLQLKINYLEDKIQEYKDQNGHAAKEARDKIEELRKKIGLVERRNRAIVEQISCSICYEDLTIPEYPGDSPTIEWLEENGIVSCSSCFVRTHFGCYKKLLDKSHCMSCRLSTMEHKPTFVYINKKRKEGSKANHQKNAGGEIEVNDEEHQIITEEEETEYETENIYPSFETKKEAFEEIIKDVKTREIVDLDDTPLRKKPIPKLLIFLNITNDENNANTNIMQTLIDNKYNIYMLKKGNITQKSLAEKYHIDLKLKGIFKIAATKTKIPEHIEKFKEDKSKAAFIMDSIHDASGTDFEFITDLICYSNFANMVQVQGRGDRPGREFKFNLYIIAYETEDEKIERNQHEKKNLIVEQNVENNIQYDDNDNEI